MEKKISIITPVYNGERYIEECIKSIINQDYQKYEHIIVDGESTDNTIDIIKNYKDKYPMKFISEKDNGMYDAIAKGFEMADGEILAWLNSDDTYLPWALRVMNYAISIGSISWATCMQGTQNLNGVIYEVAPPHYYRKKWIEKGFYDGKKLKFIQQESTFWTKELYDRINGGSVIRNYNYAGDYYLWREFAKTTELVTINTIIGSFRKHEGQKTGNMEEYYSEAKPGKKDIITILDYIYNLYPPVFRPFHKRLTIDRNKI